MRLFLIVVALLSAAPKASELKASALTAFHALTTEAIEAKAGASVPAGPWQRIDVSEKIRSASFGHSTTLVVSGKSSTFFIEYGRSTNSPAKTFGPFALSGAADAGVTCGRATCASGQVCCNASCGICTPPDGMCAQLECSPDGGR
jgi:hypothetical protein